ncbi:MAG: hypothetical protein ABMA64_18320 [Myxococcota bacterium]
MYESNQAIRFDWRSTRLANWHDQAWNHTRPVDAAGIEALEDALPHLLAVPARCSRTGPDLAVTVVVHLVEIYQVRGPTDTYLAATEHAVAAARLSGDRLPEALNARGSCHLRSGSGDLAERDFREAAGRVTDDAERAWLNGSLALAMAEGGKVSEGVELLRGAIPMLTGPRRAAAMANLASLRINQGDTSADSEQLTRAALTEATAHGRHLVAAGIRANLGLLLSRAGRPDEAEQELVRAIDEQRRLRSSRQLGATLASLAALRLDQGRLDEADALAAEAETLARRTGYTRALATVLTFRGLLEVALGDPTEGCRRVDEAEMLTDEATPGWIDLDLVRAVLLAAAGRLDQADAALARGGREDELVPAVRAHLAAARVRASRAARVAVEDADRVAIDAARRSSPLGLAARFLVAQLPDELA